MDTTTMINVENTDVTITLAPAFLEKLQKFPEMGAVDVELSEGGITMVITWVHEGLENYPKMGSNDPKQAVEELKEKYHEMFPKAVVFTADAGLGAVEFRVQLLT
jgi:hypothetical protein